MFKRFFKVTLVAILFSSLYSCATTNELNALDSSTRSYERAIRWGEFSRAKAFHKNNPYLADLERRRLKFYRVTGYNVIQNQTPNINNSHILVEIKYYKNERPVVKTLTVKQHWKRDKGTEIWYLDSAFPKFR